MRKRTYPNNEKYKQMTLEFLACTGTKIPKTKLAKLLYLADFAWFYEHLESMSGMTYKKTERGAELVEYFPVREKTNLLSKEEKELIQKIERKWRKPNTKQIVHFTHTQLPYALARKNDIISYALITQEDPDAVY